MKVIRDNLWLCLDCHFAAAGVDNDTIEPRQKAATEGGLRVLGPNLVPDYNRRQVRTE
jgi:hypothetical protein